ncbi:PREDICTED: E3 ubiquitin-protein ligase At4g11680-like [Camelina sativa]|uniref:RING-type E3 ubiquitin transferase n=1 Tax=Camelina sativa TaxID=90675 RepID=A0ABM0T7P5_CAMSA|nr:PREDICTED: E3 ubiquitin-protein ligase At4g11680-like [Camelina sativa]
MSTTMTNTTESDSSSSRVSRLNSDGIIDTTPFLPPTTVSRTISVDEEPNPIHRSARRQGLREAARFLRHAGSRRMMREPSMLVRETAAEQLEERQSDWAYSKPVVFLDILWNLAFVAIGVAVLILSRDERPNVPLRVWVVGYGFQCGLHMACVCVEYRRRRRRRGRGLRHRSSSSSSEDDGIGFTNSSQQYVSLAQLEDRGSTTSNPAKHLESANTMFSFFWWIIGFYWVSAGGQTLSGDSPQLYWLCIIFLGFDVFFVVFCVALACVIGLAICCCLPCIIAILYAVADQEGASKNDIEQMPKFRFRKSSSDEKLSGIMTECGTDSPIEHSLSPEDAECCICLCEYEDGVELRELPCNHHFHCTCIDKWLHINSRCPLCKFNILKNANEEV